MGPVSIMGLGAFIMAAAVRADSGPWLLYWLLGLGACGLDLVIQRYK